jgi:colanic acid/amylovoran biosynthesis glycosyltransferase
VAFATPGLSRPELTVEKSGTVTRDLLLLTTNHPFTHTGGETMFVEPELPHLVQRFGTVRLVPLHTRGQRLVVPEGVSLELGLAQRWRRHKALHFLRALAWPGFWPELWRGLQQGGVWGAARVWRWAAVASATWAWMQGALPRKSGASSLLYTYWRGGQTLAAVRWRSQRDNSLVVCRVHRYELYEEAFDPPFQPWTSLYASLAQVITVAQQGADYLRARGVGRLFVSRLGVAAAQQRAAASGDGVWRVVSCSMVSPVKRVDRCLQALCALAQAHPKRQIQWTHFGDGPDMAALRQLVATAPANLHVNLRGQQPNAEVLRHYQTQPVDLFMLLSSSEGLPVSIQEALAHAIPVLATDVGGVAEAVDRKGHNGALLAVDATQATVVTALERLLLAPAADMAARREAAWQRWCQDFDAQRNHAVLAARLAALEPHMP